jgi:hypothetical protein
LPDYRVEHGTVSDDETTWLLSSTVDAGAGLGRLKSDVLVHGQGGTVPVVADAKYKRLENKWPERRQGVDRGDLYQLTSYLARYSPHGESLGLLIYPQGLEPGYSTAEAKGPWHLEGGGEVRFLRLSGTIGEAVSELRSIFSSKAAP